MNEYEDWQGSRWDFTRQKSQWHFDPTRRPEPGLDSYTHVCRFRADFSDAIESCMPRVKASSWATRNNYDHRIEQEGLYSATPEQQDLVRAGADPNMEIFSRAAAEDIEIFQRIADWLGMERSVIKFHNQRTGQMLVTHIDNFAARPERDNSYLVTEFDRTPNIMRRFAIMLAPWQLGQVFQLGNANFTQWQAGDCITWEWRDIPHATCNMGWWDRPMLQITGYVTDKTQQRLLTADNNKEIYI